MMSIVTGNIELDFFDQNPVLKVKTEFKNLLEKHPKEASKIAWSVFMIEDNTKSNPLRNMSREDRVKEVQTNYYKLDLVLHRPLMTAYSKLCMSREEHMYKAQQEKMDQLTSYMTDLDLDTNTGFNQTIKIMTGLGKMWTGLEQAHTRMIDTESKVNLRGNIKESYREKKNRV